MSFLFSRHSEFLRKLFEEQALVASVSVELPDVEGFPPIVNVRPSYNPFFLFSSCLKIGIFFFAVLLASILH
jgi:hypothetical protein